MRAAYPKLKCLLGVMSAGSGRRRPRPHAPRSRRVSLQSGLRQAFTQLARENRDATAGIHRGAQQRNGVAGRSARAATGNAGHRVSRHDDARARLPFRYRISSRARRTRICRRPQRCDRVPLGAGTVRTPARIGGRSGLSRKVNVIAAVSGPAALAAKGATATIPFVFATGLDVIKAGIVASFNRPDGNATGVYLYTGALQPKKLELLAQLAPNAATIAVLANPNSPIVETQVKELQEAARLLGRRLIVLNASSEKEIDAAFAALVQQRANGLIVSADPFFNGQRAQLVALAARSVIPAIYEWREFTIAGGLVSYGTNVTDAYRQAGNYTGRILKGEKPADLPVVQPTKFEFVINLRTAKALGIDVPPKLLALTDEVIE